MGVVGSLGIRDNMSAVLRTVRKENNALKDDVLKVKKVLADTWDKKRTAKLDATAACKAADALKKKTDPFRKKLVQTLAVKDLATEKIKSVTNKVKAVGKMVASPVVKLKDNISSGLKNIGGKIKNIAQKTVIPITVAATVAAAGIGGAVKSGMQLEQQQVSMQHFIGATNKGADQATVKKISDEYMNALRDNANSTPFETGDVIQAGSRAIAVANGDTKEAMNLVKLAEDMAAASGGTKSIGDAVEALADAKLGETERLKEFGFKVSAEEFKSKGFDGVSKDLGDFYGGASEKLATTGAGLLSTIKGKLKSNFSDFGLQVVDKLKPAFESVIKLIEKASPFIEQFGSKIADGVGKGITFISEAIPKLISGLVSGIGTVIQTLSPVFNKVFGDIGDKVGGVIDFIGSKMSFITDVISWAAPFISDIFSTAWSVISPVIDIVINVFKMLFSVCEKVFPGIQRILETVWKVIKPIVDGIGTVVGGIAKGFGWIADKISGSNDKKVGTNASGTNNWRGGLTWVGERGPELMNLPGGTRILPNKESVSYAGRSSTSRLASAIHITIAKLADQIIVREDADIDRIGTDITRKVLEAIKGVVPA